MGEGERGGHATSPNNRNPPFGKGGLGGILGLLHIHDLEILGLLIPLKLSSPDGTEWNPGRAACVLPDSVHTASGLQRCTQCSSRGDTCLAPTDVADTQATSRVRLEVLFRVQ